MKAEEKSTMTKNQKEIYDALVEWAEDLANKRKKAEEVLFLDRSKDENKR